MPTYQYACTECGHAFEQVQSFSEDSLTVCPQCQGRLRKVYNAVGVVFKGSGFYKTDSRGSGRTGASTSEGDTSSKADGGGSSTGADTGGTSSDATKAGSTTGTSSTPSGAGSGASGSTTTAGASTS